MAPNIFPICTTPIVSLSVHGTSVKVAIPTAPKHARLGIFFWKLDQFKTSGFDAVMFHDDDVVPDIDTKTFGSGSPGGG